MGALELALAVVVEAAIICLIIGIVDIFKNIDND